jgi:hypothetical protein
MELQKQCCKDWFKGYVCNCLICKPEPVAPVLPLIPVHNHNHKEAFSLMNYGCKCGHTEVIWNSRDGVTPFQVPCPSCGKDLIHVAWKNDKYAPDHKPHFGQRMFINLTRERAEKIASIRHQAVTAPLANNPRILAKIVESLYMNGFAPDLVVNGYGGQL